MTVLESLIRYKVLSNSGVQHGQGTVWKAHDLLFDEAVALKEIRFDLRTDSSATLAFEKEAAVGARLGHRYSNIVKVVDFGQVDGVLYFAMEWIEGGNLGDKCGAVSLEKAKSILRQISHAVQKAHEHGIVHSDIAPLNILYDAKEETYKLADFGYLKVVDSILVSRGDRSLLVGGRPYYLPPEHLLNPNLINKSSDVYALALSLHALLTGRALDRDAQGKLSIPGTINIRLENKVAPDEVRQLLERFVRGRSDTDSVEEFRRYLDRIP